MAANTTAANLLNILKTIGKKQVPIDYLAQSLKRRSEEVMPTLKDLERSKIVKIEGGNVSLK